MESLAVNVKGNIDHKYLEHFHEILRDQTDIFTNNIYAKKHIYHIPCGMIQNKDILVVKDDKDSTIATMKKKQIL